MNDLIQFPGNPMINPEIDRLIDVLEQGGMTFGIIEDGRAKLSLTFEIISAPVSAAAFQAMHTLHERFSHDMDLRDELQDYCISMGSYYLEIGSVEATARRGA